MASTTLLDLKYRTFDSLLNEVYVDLPSFAREGMIEPGQLIKIAQDINYEIGLKIHETKETILDVEFGRAKLPADFHILNLALLCHQGEVIQPGLFNGLHTENVPIPVPNLSIPQLTSCPCWTLETIHAPSQVSVTYCNGNYIHSLPVPVGITKICASLVVPLLGAPTVAISTSNFCYNIPATGEYSCTIPDTPCCTLTAPQDSCGVIDPDPWHQNRVYTQCDGTMQVNVIQWGSNETIRYRNFEKVYMVPSKQATAFCINTNFRNTRHTGNIKNGFIYLPTMHHRENEENNDGHGKLYICYLGAMEDEQGNLLVLDHPKINLYYEWALKKRIFQNQYLNGEPDIERRLALIDKEFKFARAEALGISTMPDFKELCETIERNRKIAYHKYMHPFSRLFANSNGYPWGINETMI